MALLSSICFNLAIASLFGSITVTLASATGENFVRPSENETCQYNPCLPLDDYAMKAEQYFVDDTIFIFLPGTHQLSISIHLKNKSNISLLVRNNDKWRNDTTLFFRPFVSISWTNCSEIDISDLHIFLSDQGIAGNKSFSTLFFYGTSSSLSRLIFQGNETGAILINDSWMKVSNVTVCGASRIQGPALYAENSIVEIFGKNFFIDNRADVEGGAVVFKNCACNMNGTISFVNNTAAFGGAMALFAANCDIYGDISFISNNAKIEGGALFLNGSQCSISGKVSFVENSADHGGAISVYDTETDVTLNSVDFTSNSATYTGGAMYLAYGDHSIAGNNVLFVNNYAGFSGGAIKMLSGNHSISGNISFENNLSDNHGGAVALTDNCHISGTFSFINNTAVIGGAIYTEDGIANIHGTLQFVWNSAEQGGAMAFTGTSKLILDDPLTLDFFENHAVLYGGGIFVNDDDDDDDQCSNIPKQPKNLEECSFEFSDYHASDIHLNFINNTAVQAGKILHGGSIDNCKLYIQGGYFDDCGNRQGGKYDTDPISKFQNISSVTSVADNISDISSNPLKVCFCDKHGSEFYCADQKRKIVRGEEIIIKAVIVGQSDRIIPSTVRVHLDNSVEINSTQHVQMTTNECTDIRYRLLSSIENTTTLVLFPQDSPCRDSGISRRKIEVTFNICPDAFDLQEGKCVCNKRLRQYTKNCIVNDNYSILRSSTDTFWMGVDYYVYDDTTSKFKGLILHHECPFDYCTDQPVSITLDNLDVQCNHSRADILCGSCKKNYSIAFGTMHCLPCSNAYLALILPFSLVGIALVAVLLLLELSVANGTINGLIFYANIVQANRSTFFPPGKTNPLTIFIAWLNLDLGIETCFYDGMNAYAFAWLQFVFPFYVWFLIGLIIVVARCSLRATRILGTNPVAALATLLLLSYSKLLRTIIMALSTTHLEYPDKNERVWLYDGSVPYFKRADHITLGVFAILVLLFLFVPYTLLLFCGHWLQAYSHWKVFSWINKLNPIMDAYHAPYKKETRYWTGLLLVIRCILSIVFGLNAFGNHAANINLLAITTFTACLPALASLHKGIYKTTYNNILEAFFIVNLCIFSAATYHVKEIDGNQAGVAYTFIGVAFSTFFMIVLLSVYVALRKTSFGKKLPSLNDKLNAVAQFLCKVANGPDNQRAGRDDVAIGGRDEQQNSVDQAPTTSFIDIREYEPLLDKK